MSEFFKSLKSRMILIGIGEQFDAIVTGASPRGTWVRILHPPIEGKLVHDFNSVDVDHRIRVQLIHTDVEQGFIDFKRIG